MKALLWGEIAYAGTAVLGAAILWRFGILNSRYALGCLALACVMGSFIGLRQSKQLFRFNLAYSKTAFSETSKYSGWALVGVIIFTLQSQSYVYLLSALTSLSETAEINAGKMFLMPIGLLIGGIGRIFLPKGSEILNKGGGHGRLIKLLTITISILIALSILYCVALGLFFKEVVQLTIGNKYSEIGRYFLLWAGVFIAQVIRYPMVSALQVLKKFKYMAFIGAICAAVTLAGCFFGIKMFGGKGVIAALLCGEVVGIVFYFPALKGKTS
jgi:O-antigen/teichoic acid export membrane protein